MPESLNEPAWVTSLRASGFDVEVQGPMMCRVTRGAVRAWLNYYGQPEEIKAGITDFASDARGQTNAFLTDLRKAFVFLEARDIRTPAARSYWRRQLNKGLIDNIDGARL